MVSDGPVVGIDLGTTNSLVAFSDEAGPRILRDEHGRALVPSVVRYGVGEPVVGHAARADAGPGTIVASVKRLMGRAAAELAADAPYLGYRVVPGENGAARVALEGGVLITPEEVSAAILRRLKAIAEAGLGVPVRRAVVTVPAYFDDAQRQATRTAAMLAGLDAVRLVPEPTAAALAYGLGLGRAGTARHVAVYDLGGGTFDISILRLTPGDADEPYYFQVLAVGGDTHLGGDDMDRALAGLLGAGASAGVMALAEGAKRRLTDAERTTVEVEGRGAVEVTREDFEGAIGPLVDRTLDACRRVMIAAAGALDGAPLDAVVLVGGATRVPLVRRRVAAFFGLNPYTALNPDEVVALGAAVQAQVLGGGRRDALLLDVLPLSLGIETAGGAVAKVIVRNSTVPAQATEMFSTQKDGQTGIRLTVYQGEREMAEHCRKLGEFHLSGLPPMPAGVPQVEVRFNVDANGVLHVTAHERRSGRRASLQVVPNHGLTPAEVERIERESLIHAREDMTRHRVVDLVANSRLDLRWIGDGLHRHRAALDAEYAAELDALVAALRGLVERAEADWRSVDAEAFARAKDALDRAGVRLQEVAIAASLRGESPA